MRELLGRLQPTYFGDIVATISLFRPGPIQGGVGQALYVKEGTALRTYPTTTRSSSRYLRRPTAWSSTRNRSYR